MPVVALPDSSACTPLGLTPPVPRERLLWVMLTQAPTPLTPGTLGRHRVGVVQAALVIYLLPRPAGWASLWGLSAWMWPGSCCSGLQHGCLNLSTLGRGQTGPPRS